MSFTNSITHLFNAIVMLKDKEKSMMEGSVLSSFEHNDDDEEDSGGGNEDDEEVVTTKFNIAKLAKMLRSFADVAESMQG